jgi:hypothetical protein
MPLRRLVRSLAGFAMPMAAMLFLTGCAKDIVRLDRNRPPQTFIVAAPLDSAGIGGPNTKASYRVHLYWRGEDSDGFVVGFLWSFDDSSIGAARYTTKTDSIFELLVNDSTVFTGTETPGVSKYHTFFIRAVDNLGKSDPGIAIFNKRTFLAQTLKPRVGFLGALPEHRKRVIWVGPQPADSDTVELVDTLADRTPFQVCWTGYDPDNPPDFGVPRYQVTAGTYMSGISGDTCAYFNDPSSPKSISLASGLYKLTVKGFDVANAVGDSSFVFVVNYDPDTWIKPRGAPIGHYIQPYLGGNELTVPLEGTFAPGDTVPFRSTVWWDWDAADSSHGEPNCIAGWSVFLSPGSRNGGDPYTIGFLDVLDPTANPPVRFTTNNPAVVGPPGFVSLILDSLDAVYNIHLFVRAEDCSGRIDGTPDIFAFNCNYPPKLNSVSVDSTIALNQTTGQIEEHLRISWDGSDYEDGKTTFARLTIDGTLNKELSNGEQEYLIPLSTFQGLSPGACEGSVRIRVADRAGVYISKDEEIEVRFPLPDPSCP